MFIVEIVSKSKGRDVKVYTDGSWNTMLEYNVGNLSGSVHLHVK